MSKTISMNFASFPFLIFFLSVCILFYIIPHKYRWLLLLVSSCFFYMNSVPSYILILGLTIIINYLAGISIDKSVGQSRKTALVISLIANVAVLSFFKYMNFLGDGITHLFSSFGYENTLDSKIYYLPIGLSFHTLQGISYCIEVYRSKQPVEKKFGIFSLYILFFPQVMAGPVERPQNLIHQFYEPKKLEYENVIYGLRLLLWGFFKKLVIADRLAVYVGAVYEDPHRQSGITLFLATLFFVFQIYADFSGYADIAIGTGKILGYDIAENFRRPLFGKSIAEKCRRWHISLYTWLRDYIYTPITKKNGGETNFFRMIIGILIVFLVSSFWHGAKFTFLAWSLTTALLLIGERLFKKVINPSKFLPKIVMIFFGTILSAILLLPTAILFRALSIQDAVYIIKTIGSFHMGHIFKGEPPLAFFYGIFGCSFLFIVEFFQEYFPSLKIINSRYAIIRFAAYAVLATLLLMIGVYDNTSFLYYHF